MKRFRKCALAVSLVVTLSLGAATSRPVLGDGSHESTFWPSEDTISLILDFVVLYSRISLPPG